MSCGEYSGTAGDSLTGGFHPEVKWWADHRGMKFSTRDRDNDNYEGNCAEEEKAGWWFNRYFNFISVLSTVLLCMYSYNNNIQSKKGYALFIVIAIRPWPLPEISVLTGPRPALEVPIHTDQLKVSVKFAISFAFHCLFAMGFGHLCSQTVRRRQFCPFKVTSVYTSRSCRVCRCIPAVLHSCISPLFH